MKKNITLIMILVFCTVTFNSSIAGTKSRTAKGIVKNVKKIFGIGTLRVVGAGAILGSVEASVINETSTEFTIKQQFAAMTSDGDRIIMPAGTYKILKRTEATIKIKDSNKNRYLRVEVSI